MNKNEKSVNSIPKKHWMVWHGALGDEKWPLPKCVARTTKVNRKDQGNKTNASEFMDSEEVLDAKMKLVAEIIQQSKYMVAYTGAGISRAAGIPDYGTKAESSVMNSVKKVKNVANCLPTFAHKVLANLERNDYLKYYVQQNHDGLPQKAGFPQHKMNEIHGAWFDPSNPVVQFSGNLRSDLFNAMIEVEQMEDFCLCLGTSLSGMNADRMITTPCERFAGGEEGCLGGCIVNLQFTPVDKVGYVAVRVWGKIDDAMRLLAKHLKMEVKDFSIPEVKGDRIVCHYDKNGFFDETKKMILDVSIGSKVVIIHPDAVNKGKEGVVMGKDNLGNYQIRFGNRIRRFGKWWLKTIESGEVLNLPLRNINPTFKKRQKEEKEKN